MRRTGIRKTVTGGKIKKAFEVQQTDRGKEIIAVRVFDDEKEKKNVRRRKQS